MALEHVKVGAHPVVVVTRDTAIPVLPSLVCVLIPAASMGTLRRWPSVEKRD